MTVAPAPPRRTGTTESEAPGPERVSLRLRAAELIAFVGLVAAFIGALGPAGDVRSTYSWPPASIPEGTPDRVWYTPLLLAQRAPDQIGMEVPCAVPSSLAGAVNADAVVLSTARSFRDEGGLGVTRDGRMLTFW